MNPRDVKEIAKGSVGMMLAIAVPLVALAVQRAHRQERKKSSSHAKHEHWAEQVENLLPLCSSPAPVPVLLELPDTVLREVMLSWLQFHDLAKLETALCNRRSLAQLHAVFPSPDISQNISVDINHLSSNEKSLGKIYKWADKRGLRPTSLLLTSAALVDIARGKLLGSHVEQIFYQVPETDANRCFEIVVTACTRLRSLYVNAGLSKKSFTLLASNGKHLTALDVATNGHLMDTADFLRICKGCPGLVQLTFGRPESLTERSLLRGLAELPLLKDLRYLPVQPLSFETLGAVSELYPHLEIFHTTFNIGMPDQDLLNFARLFPNLTSLDRPLRARCLNPPSRETLIELFRLCPRVNTWEIPVLLSMEDVEAVLTAHGGFTELTVELTYSCTVLEVVTRCCPQLQQLTVMVVEFIPRTPSELDEALLPVARACPKFRSLIFLSAKTMTADGIRRFALRCPTLGEVLLFQSSPGLSVAKRRELARAVPRLRVKVVQQIFSLAVL